MAPPAPEMAATYRSLYPFPEYQATCRGGDEDVPAFLIHEDAEFHNRCGSVGLIRAEFFLVNYLGGRFFPFSLGVGVFLHFTRNPLTCNSFTSRYPGLFFMAQRGLLDYLLFSTWEYRWAYHRDLFRSDRRPHAQRRRGESVAHADKGHGRPTGNGQRTRGNALLSTPDDPLAELNDYTSPGSSSSSSGSSGGSGRSGNTASVPSAGAGVRAVLSPWGHSFIVFEGPPALAPSPEVVEAAQKAVSVAAEAFASSARSSSSSSSSSFSRRSAASGSAPPEEWNQWDLVDLGLQHATSPLLFSFRPVGDIVDSSRSAICVILFFMHISHNSF